MGLSCIYLSVTAQGVPSRFGGVSPESPSRIPRISTPLPPMIPRLESHEYQQSPTLRYHSEQRPPPAKDGLYSSLEIRLRTSSPFPYDIQDDASRSTGRNSPPSPLPPSPLGLTTELHQPHLPDQKYHLNHQYLSEYVERIRRIPYPSDKYPGRCICPPGHCYCDEWGGKIPGSKTEVDWSRMHLNF